MTIVHTPDAEQPDARQLVDHLHDIASRATGDLRDTLADVAALLDGYQAGLILATPHACTGYVLVRAGCRAKLGAVATQSREHAA